MYIISQQAAAALRSKTEYKNANTEVFVQPGYVDDKRPMVLSLWDNLIAKLYDDGALYVSCAGWDTRTTCERLRALGVKIWHKRGQLMIGDIAINSYDWYKINDKGVIDA